MTTALTVIGNISIDTACYPNGDVHTFVGGAGLHVSLAAVRAGLPAALIAIAGNDLPDINGVVADLGIDTTRLLVADGATCRFKLIYNSDGTLAEVNSKFGVADDLTEHARRSLEGAHRHHVSCRRPLMPELLLPHLPVAETSVDFHGPSAFDMMAAVRDALPTFAAIFVNAAERRTLVNSVDPTTLRCLVVTDGPRAATVSRFGQQVAATTPPARQTTDVTGAGDTLAGTFLAHLYTGRTDQQALDLAVAAAADTVITVGASGLDAMQASKPTTGL